MPLSVQCSHSPCRDTSHGLTSTDRAASSKHEFSRGMRKESIYFANQAALLTNLLYLTTGRVQDTYTQHAGRHSRSSRFAQRGELKKTQTKQIKNISLNDLCEGSITSEHTGVAPEDRAPEEKRSCTGSAGRAAQTLTTAAMGAGARLGPCQPTGHRHGSVRSSPSLPSPRGSPDGETPAPAVLLAPHHQQLLLDRREGHGARPSGRTVTPAGMWARPRWQELRLRKQAASQFCEN